MLFQGNVTRSEVLLIAANDGRSNLLEKSFLDALWDLHMRILDLKVTDEDDGDGLAAAAAAIAQIGDTLELPIRRLEQSQPSFQNDTVSTKTDGKELLQHEGGSSFLPSSHRRLAFGDPAAMVQQQLVQQQLMQQQLQQAQWVQRDPVVGGGRRRRDALAASAAAAAQPQQQQLYVPAGAEEVCDPEKQLPRNRITGLGCRAPLAPGEFGFANLCAKDATGACEAPDGIIFVYGHKRYAFRAPQAGLASPGGRKEPLL